MADPSLPVEVLLGIYLGILTGIIPALVAWGLGFIFKYFTGVTLPGFGVVVLGLALAGVNGGLLALTDDTVRQSSTAPALVTAIVVVTMLTLYAHSRGDAMGATLPKRLSLRALRERTLSADVIERVGGRGHVRVRVAGDVADMEGYPPLPSPLRAGIQASAWPLPADLPIAELERRFAERLRTEFGLADVSVRMDERGEARVVAAPPLSGLSRRVPDGKRAVSVPALVPTGMCRGDEVRVTTQDVTVSGTVVSARSGDGGTGLAAAPGAGPDTGPVPDGGEEPSDADASREPERAPTTIGGEGRVTVAVAREDAEQLLAADRARVVVTARGTRREFELVSLLGRTGKRFRKLTVRTEGPLDGTTIGETTLRETYDVAVLAVRRPDGWVLAPHGDARLAGGDDLFAVGTPDALDAFAEVVA